MLSNAASSRSLSILACCSYSSSLLCRSVISLIYLSSISSFSCLACSSAAKTSYFSDTSLTRLFLIHSWSASASRDYFLAYLSWFIFSLSSRVYKSLRSAYLCWLSSSANWLFSCSYSSRNLCSLSYSDSLSWDSANLRSEINFSSSSNFYAECLSWISFNISFICSSFSICSSSLAFYKSALIFSIYYSL